MKGLSVLLWFMVCLCTSFVRAQSQGGYFIVDSIVFEGNTKTKDRVFLRELDFKVGDTLDQLTIDERLQTNYLLVMNSNLLSRSKVDYRIISPDKGTITVVFDVQELWYIFPIPIFELADRNFNVWWVDQMRDLDRINFGLRFTHNNFSGHRDKLKATFQLGYTQKFEVDYVFPIINPKIGFTFNTLYSRNKEIQYGTLYNRQLFFRDDDNYIFQRYRIVLGFTYRPKLQTTHYATLEYYSRIISEEVSDLNPSFFSGATVQQHPAISYTFLMDKRDIRAYPLHGYFATLSVRKDGFPVLNDNINSFSTRVQLDKYLSLHPRLSTETRLTVKNEWSKSIIPYHNSRAFGFLDDYVRGYEYYVAEGRDFYLLRNSLRIKILDKELNFTKIIDLNLLKAFPLRTYFTVNGDMGYVNNPDYSNNNPLSNSLLYGYGVGLDFVYLYSKLVQIEYSINRLGEKGLFLHLRFDFGNRG